MLPFLLLCAGICCLALFALRRSSRRKTVPTARIVGKPHQCKISRNFMPVARTRSMKVGERGRLPVSVAAPDGPRTFELPEEMRVTICEGVFCSACEQRLECTCGRTPTEDIIIDDRVGPASVLACCSDPHFIESDAPDSRAALAVGRRFGGKHNAQA